MAISPDGRHIYVSTYMNHLYAFERQNESEKNALLTEDEIVARDVIAVKPDSSLLVSRGSKPSYKNFEHIMTEVDIREMLREVTTQPEKWPAGTTKQDEMAMQGETESIFLRSAVPSDDKSRKLEDIHASRRTPNASSYPAIMQWTESFAGREGKRVGRALLAKLKPHDQFYPQVDEGDYYQVRDRYYLVLASASGSNMVCGYEEVVMREGDVWWFDNKQLHAASNMSDSDQIYLIFDLEYPD